MRLVLGLPGRSPWGSRVAAHARVGAELPIEKRDPGRAVRAGAAPPTSWAAPSARSFRSCGSSRSSSTIARAPAPPLGTAYAATQPADGYTLLLAPPPFVIMPHVYSNLRYKALEDFRAVSVIAYYPLVTVVHPSLPVNNLKELFALRPRQARHCLCVGRARHVAASHFGVHGPGGEARHGACAVSQRRPGA